MMIGGNGLEDMAMYRVDYVTLVSGLCLGAVMLMVADSILG